MQLRKRGNERSRLESHIGDSDTVIDLDDSSVNDTLPDEDNIAKPRKASTHRRPSLRKIHSAETVRRFYESKNVIFIFGAFIGIAVALYFGATSSEYPIPDIDQLVNFDSLSTYFDDWKDVLPKSLQSIVESTQFNQNSKILSSESFAVGKQLKSKSMIEANHSIVLVPGVISTGLESWGLEGTPDCPSEGHFRKRLWGSFYMLRTMFLDKACWLKHIMLDTTTGLDPPGISLRAAQGFEAADFFIAGYWIWNKILQNLAVIGYNPNNMVSAAYDWRLAFLDLELRDAYFSKLKGFVELQKHQSGKKSVLVGHSMGSQVIYYFMKWVEADGYGNGGPNWVNDHVDSFVDISGCMLGTPKAIPALLSGEMKDTVQLNALAVEGLEKFLSRRERADMIRSFGGIASMIPKGGDLIWGNLESSPDDATSIGDLGNDTYGNFIRFKEPVGKYSQKNLTVTDSIQFLMEQTPAWFQDRMLRAYSYGFTNSAKQLKKNNKDHTKWSNPLEASLPNAPDLKVFCFYGFGNPTERAYYYREEVDPAKTKLNVTIEKNYDSVLMADGDGTVSLMTHSMCHIWKQANSVYNPGNSKVKIVEIDHEPDRFDIRGGAKTAEHVDILGSAELNELVLLVAAGKGDQIKEKIVSNLKEIVDNLELDL
ncbi:Acyltransferase [Komagataella phaffii CBS 7435]|uniref:Phospholipid:diacylglycerol acyltransferase n=2 Tax=Komagataella phaffii TaxID=460519 RepID=C4R1G7_KOMPG|nr:uncharacterized protein PAS_chr2-1_0878 [Komagataella phaffii GS115]AOA62882.1 GQ67_00759T0 [Komagataella phaffii]CAH2448129.1 Acyltransferase [Komagataella phaffii CBS 7435]AOA67065.1 GQ68_00630T0 [Komagataella phaffii GS115]CAY69341.1 hypothetical protein PAS_chr2-1_0878 [Komagataella phaffii GS115]CCA38274.1 Acyltransferase [Komagataella phaffii CBS 7435]